jgi:hypothetical protein
VRFIDKATHIICNMNNYTSYLSGQLVTIGKTISNIVGRVDSIAVLLQDYICAKVKQYTG